MRAPISWARSESFIAVSLTTFMHKRYKRARDSREWVYNASTEKLAMSRTSALRIEQALSVEEYLAFERAADTKHEYEDAEIIAFAGAGSKHKLLMTNCPWH